MCVISVGKYDAIFDMLGEMNVPERSSAIFDWSIGGQIIYDFIWLRKQLDSGKDIAEYFGTVQPRNIGFEGINIICYGLIFVISLMSFKQKNFHCTVDDLILFYARHDFPPRFLPLCLK